MFILRRIINWGWCPILITALAIVGHVYEWPMWFLATVLVVVLILGIVVAIARAEEKDLERASMRLKQLAGYFNRRFTGDSALSIFVVIRSLLTSDNAKVWAWARECEVAQRIFNTWCNSFISRVESDIRTRHFGIYLRTYQSELWMITSHYHEFIEQFYEVAESIEIPKETIDQYNRLVEEYNAFVQNFRDNLAEMRRVARTEIEPPSVKFAKALPGKQATPQEEETKPPRTPHERGQIV
jgi:hypothetical protein